MFGSSCSWNLWFISFFCGFGWCGGWWLLRFLDFLIFQLFIWFQLISIFFIVILFIIRFALWFTFWFWFIIVTLFLCLTAQFCCNFVNFIWLRILSLSLLCNRSCYFLRVSSLFWSWLFNCFHNWSWIMFFYNFGRYNRSLRITLLT